MFEAMAVAGGMLADPEALLMLLSGALLGATFGALPGLGGIIALAVSHVVKCPYCIDAYTKDGLQRGITKEEMMEAVHAGAAIESGATLVHGVQMMNKYKKLSM